MSESAAPVTLSADARQALFGTDEPLPVSRTLTVGRFSFDFERGLVRRFALDGVELIRSVGFVVRDPQWGTLAYTPADVSIAEIAGTVSIRFSGQVSSGSAGLTFEVAYDLDKDGHLRCQVSGTAQSTFETCRTGFVVLYPLESAVGRPLRIEHPDGTSEDSEFPVLVSPGQPAFEIAALSHEPLPGVTMTCRFSGEVFEMEDHRNWTDASFKVYSRPLSRPRPFTIADGEAITQSVDIAITGRPKAANAGASFNQDAPSALRIGKADGVLPGFGTWIGPADAPFSNEASKACAGTAFDHIVCTVGRIGAKAMRRYAERLRAVGHSGDVMLEAIVSGEEPERELSALAAEAQAEGIEPAAVSVFMEPYLTSYQPDGVWPRTAGFERLYAGARAAFPNAAIGGGMYSFFTELNRCRQAAAGVDFVTHTASPLVHDSDDISVMQTLEALPDVFATLRSFSPGLPSRLGPVFIGLRHNPGGVPVPANPDNRRHVTTSDDPRWQGLYGASWMVGYAAEASRAGLEAVTFGSLAGPGALCTPAGGRSPAIRVMQALTEASRRPRLSLSVPASRLRGLAWLDEDGRRRLILANTSDRPLSVDLGDATKVDVIDVEALTQSGNGAGGTRAIASDTPMALGPYAVAFATL